MSQELFTALERRFNANKGLTRFARKLYEGLGPEDIKQRPYVAVTIDGPSHEFDSFDGDEPLYSLTFDIKTRDAQSKRAWKIHEQMIITFDDGDIVGASFETVSCRQTGGIAPHMVDGKFEASMDFDWMISMKSTVPATRGT